MAIHSAGTSYAQESQRGLLLSLYAMAAWGNQTHPTDRRRLNTDTADRQHMHALQHSYYRMNILNTDIFGDSHVSSSSACRSECVFEFEGSSITKSKKRKIITTH